MQRKGLLVAHPFLGKAIVSLSEKKFRTNLNGKEREITGEHVETK